MSGIDSCPNLNDLSRWIDQEGIAGCHATSAQRSVLIDDLLVRIGDQPECQALFGAELFVTVRGVHAHADDDRVLLLVLRKVLLEIVRFDGAALGHVLRVEIEHGPFASKALETYGSPIL